MQKNKKWAIIAALILYALGTISGALLHRHWTKPIIQQTDTTTVTKTAVLDTLHQTVTPLPVPDDAPPVIVPASKVERDETDTTHYRITPDVLQVSGNLSDGLAYHATLTGVQPSLQTLTITYPERTITKSVAEPYKGWMLSATADIGAYAAPQITVATKAALELSYNTGPLHVALQGGIISTPTSGSWRPSPYIGARLTVDIYRFR